jgi:hypothetical protein
MGKTYVPATQTAAAIDLTKLISSSSSTRSHESSRELRYSEPRGGGATSNADSVTAHKRKRSRDKDESSHKLSKEKKKSRDDGGRKEKEHKHKHKEKSKDRDDYYKSSKKKSSRDDDYDDDDDRRARRGRAEKAELLKELLHREEIQISGDEEYNKEPDYIDQDELYRGEDDRNYNHNNTHVMPEQQPLDDGKREMGTQTDPLEGPIVPIPLLSFFSEPVFDESAEHASIMRYIDGPALVRDRYSSFSFRRENC